MNKHTHPSTTLSGGPGVPRQAAGAPSLRHLAVPASSTRPSGRLRTPHSRAAEPAGFRPAAALRAPGPLALLLALSLAFLAPAALSAQANPDPVALVKAMEDKINVENLDLTSTFTLVQKKEGETDKVLRIRIFRRDTANRFTMVFQFPDSEKGKGYYRNGDDLYLYLPTTREFVYRNRKDDVGSTDVRTDLFGRQDLLAQYKPAFAGSEMVSKFDTWVLRLEAKALDVSFPVQKWFIRKSDGLPVKVENYSASGTLLRTVFYIDYKEVGRGKFLFTKLMSVNNLEKNQRTLLQNDDIVTTRIPDYTFSQAFLEEQSR